MINFFKKRPFSRLSWEEYSCLLALAASTRSEDEFTQVGAALLDRNGNVLGTGTNGLKKGMEVPEWMSLEENRIKKSSLMIHAEANLWQRKKEGDGWLLGLTISPCKSCAQLIASSSIKKVVFIKEYRHGLQECKDIFDFYKIEYGELSRDSKEKIKNTLTLKTKEFFN